MQLQTIFPESKFPNEYIDVILFQINQHFKKLLPKYKGSRFYETRCRKIVQFSCIVAGRSLLMICPWVDVTTTEEEIESQKALCFAQQYIQCSKHYIWQKNIKHENVGRCPTWWPPCRIYVVPSVPHRKGWLTPTAGVPCSNAGKTRKPLKFALKFAGVPQTNETISAASGPKFTIL